MTICVSLLNALYQMSHWPSIDDFLGVTGKKVTITFCRRLLLYRYFSLETIQQNFPFCLLSTEIPLICLVCNQSEYWYRKYYFSVHANFSVLRVCLFPLPGDMKSFWRPCLLHAVPRACYNEPPALWTGYLSWLWSCYILFPVPKCRDVCRAHDLPHPFKTCQKCEKYSSQKSANESFYWMYPSETI